MNRCFSLRPMVSSAALTPQVFSSLDRLADGLCGDLHLQVTSLAEQHEYFNP